MSGVHLLQIADIAHFENVQRDFYQWAPSIPAAVAVINNISAIALGVWGLDDKTYITAVDVSTLMRIFPMDGLTLLKI